MPHTTNTPAPRVGVYYTEPKDKDQAQQLAKNLSLELVKDKTGFELLLCFTKGRLCLVAPANASRQEVTVSAEFVKEAAGYRRRQGKKELLLKAIGFTPNKPITVLDVTGGLGKDSFLIATYGCRVHILERNPIAAALLDDALHRAHTHPDTNTIAARIKFSVVDSIAFLNKPDIREKYDVIYLDPMFPERAKSALVKKEMQMLQKLIGREDDTAELFASALGAAAKRVVVKRPKTAASLKGPKPSHSISGKTTRFDVYLVGQVKNN